LKCDTSLLEQKNWSVAVGWVLMSERELNRIEVLSQLSEGRMPGYFLQPITVEACQTSTILSFSATNSIAIPMMG
jgi:hypothetical protein